jgi:hypothetical protein
MIDDEDEADQPNGGKPLLVRMSKNDRKRLDWLRKRYGISP